MTSRRNFLRQSALSVVAGSVVPNALWGGVIPAQVSRAALEREEALFAKVSLKELAARALDAAKASGAAYADVRFTRTQWQGYGSELLTQGSHVAFGVRALVDGVWGFVGLPVWNVDLIVRAAREAASQAAKNNWGGKKSVDFGPPPPAASGEWTMPVRRDPILVSVEEKSDYLKALETIGQRIGNGNMAMLMEFTRQIRTFASSDGTFITQTLFRSMGGSSVIKIDNRTADVINPVGGGFDALVDLKMEDRLVQMYEEAQRAKNPVPGDIGRYDVVFDAYAMAAILHAAVGEATEADRARGYEANAGGTSYLPAPVSLGTQVGSPLISITGTRSHPGAAGHVKWDDEGVMPTDFPILKEGRLMNYATSREHVAPMGDWYRTQGIPAVSNGCCNSETALDVPLVYPPDLRMTPAPNRDDIPELATGIKNGYLVLGGTCNMDHQRLTGQGQGNIMYEVKNGQIGRPVAGLAYLFRSPEFLKGITAIGGAASLRWRGMGISKGQPDQTAFHSVGAVPARVRNVAMVNVMAGLK